jgi:predicted double-glycine peptidase
VLVYSQTRSITKLLEGKMPRIIHWLLFVILTILPLMPSPVKADPLLLLIAWEGVRLSQQTTCIHSRRWQTTSAQTSEVTCGPAALSTLLNVYLGATTTENEMARLSGTYEQGTSTLLGLRDACAAKGFEAQGYKLTLDQLKGFLDTRHIPILVHFREPTFHYLLVAGCIEHNLLVLDPASGSLSMPEEDFLRRWSGKVLVVGSKDKQKTAPDNKSLESAKARITGLRRTGRMMSTF